jgi:hypothetical protein
MLRFESFLAVGVAVTAVYLLYRWLLPKPLVGIPYNKESSMKLLGDVPDMVAHVNRTGTIWPWVAAQSIKLNSPIIQLWTRPFSRPWVVISDFQESQSILTRRTKEFDRSAYMGDIFYGIFPNHHIIKQSADPEFKHNRALMKTLMTTGFLQEIAAPQIYSAVETLIELWNTKLAYKRPFSAEKDIFHAALDIIFGVTFGLNPEDSTNGAQTKFLQSRAKPKVPSEINKPVHFEETKNSAAFEAILTLTDSLDSILKSPSPRLHYRFIKLLPSIRAASKVKDQMIETEIQKAVDRMESDDQIQRCAVDNILHREIDLAKKESRQTSFKAPAIKDEVYMQRKQFVPKLIQI